MQQGNTPQAARDSALSSKARRGAVSAFVQKGYELKTKGLLSCIGLWTMHVWIYWFNRSTSVMSSPRPAWLNIYAAMTIALCVILVCALRTRVTSSVPDGILTRFAPYGIRTTDVIFTVLMCACTVFSTALVVRDYAPLSWQVTNCAVAGLCMGYGYTTWFVRYADLGIKKAVLCLFLSYLVGSTFKVAFDFAGPILAGSMAFTLPVISLVNLRAADIVAPQAEEGPRGRADYTKSNLSSLARILVCVAAFSVLRGLVPADNGWTGVILGHIVEVVFSVAVIIWVFARGRSLDFPQLWRFLFLFLSGALAITAAGVGGEISDLCMHVTASMLVMLLWLLLADVAHHSEINPAAIFSVGWGTYTGATYLGLLLRELVVSGQSGALPAACAVALWVLGVTMVFCLETRDPDVRRIFSDLHRGIDPQDFASLDERCRELADIHGITERELDVFQQLARGRSKNYIAEELGISENTVRGHARNIYRKLDVHTRDELQNKVAP